MTKKYTQSDLDQIVLIQLQNLNAMQDLLKVMKRQNELIEKAVWRLKDDLSCATCKQAKQATGKAAGL